MGSAAGTKKSPDCDFPLIWADIDASLYFTMWTVHSQTDLISQSIRIHIGRPSLLISLAQHVILADEC